MLQMHIFTHDSETDLWLTWRTMQSGGTVRDTEEATQIPKKQQRHGGMGGTVSGWEADDVK